MNFLIRHRNSIIGIVIGAIAGYVYYATVGCENGQCMISSRPLNSTLYGALVGFFMVHSFKKPSSSTEPHQNERAEQ